MEEKTIIVPMRVPILNPDHIPDSKSCTCKTECKSCTCTTEKKEQL